MIMTPLRAALLAAVAVCLSACGTTSCERDDPFLATTEGDPLRVPEGLASPRATGKFQIPEAASDKPVRGPCGDLPPLRKVVAAPQAAPAVDLPSPPTTAASLDPAADPALAAASGPPAISGNIEADVRDLVTEWTRAWRGADSTTLMAFYSKEFEPPVPGETRAAWAQKRAMLLEQSGPADVRFDRLVVSQTGNGATARFIQEFHNGGQINALVKELDLAREDGSWKIIRERVVDVL